MASVNKAIILGNLGKDPETRYLDSGTAVTTFSVATSTKYKDRNDEWVEKTEWHNITAWGRLAEICAEYLEKGKSVFVEGRIETRKWQDKDGNDRYTTGIVADKIQILGSKGDGTRKQDQDRGGEYDEPPFHDDDIPF